MITSLVYKNQSEVFFYKIIFKNIELTIQSLVQHLRSIIGLDIVLNQNSQTRLKQNQGNGNVSKRFNFILRIL